MLLADSLAGALLLMHTLGTVPYLRISDQTYHAETPCKARRTFCSVIDSVLDMSAPNFDSSL